MHRQPHTIHSSMTHDFFTHGIQGIETNRASERRHDERNQIRSRHITPIRHWLGTVMIAIGTGIAGNHHSMSGERTALEHPTVRNGLAVSR